MTTETPTILKSLLISSEENPKPCTSPAVLLEIQTSEGAVLLPRLTPKALAKLAHKNADNVCEAVNGMIAYEGFTHGVVVYADGHWRRLVTEKVILPEVTDDDSSQENTETSVISD